MTTPSLGPAVPVLRIVDEQLARRFYLDVLQFETVWEHRFEPALPLYTRIRRDETVLDLSGHHGDGTPGSLVLIPCADVEALQSDVASRSDMQLRPEVDPDAPGGPSLYLTDPFGNTLRFVEAS
jgi:catechol 2,3-dioxygenase-like lactoylglutathione lyase family enzyme